MAKILNIETATSLCSVVLSVDGLPLAKREIHEEKSHAAKLTAFIEEILYETGLHMNELDAVAVGKGPGSYTGLRIGVSTAKGLCYGAGIPLIAVNTLNILIKQVQISGTLDQVVFPDRERALLCPMIDARRMEVFTCITNCSGEEIEPVEAKIIDSSSYQHLLSQHTMIFFGSGMEKCQNVLSHPHAFFISGIQPHSEALALLAEDSFNKGALENIAYFEPFYLKDFIATTPKKKLPI
jgi:tRNA threonylcarbamoyladenosine biosynthesis protein TsaB